MHNQVKTKNLVNLGQARVNPIHDMLKHKNLSKPCMRTSP